MKLNHAFVLRPGCGMYSYFEVYIDLQGRKEPRQTRQVPVGEPLGLPLACVLRPLLSEAADKGSRNCIPHPT